MLPHIDEGVVEYPQRHHNWHVSRAQESDEEGESKASNSRAV